MRQHPLTASAALLFNSSSLITSPASRLRTGWLGLSIGLHLAAGAGLVIAPYFQFESLDRPSLDRPAQLVHLGGDHAAPLRGDGGKTKPQPPEHAAVKDPPQHIIRVPQNITVNPPLLIEIAQNTEPGVSGPGNNKDGKEWGTPDGTDPNAPPGHREEGGPGGGGPVGVGPMTYHDYDMNVVPKLTAHEDPVYPEAARQQGIEGSVDLKIVIDEAGRVIDVVLVRSDNPMLNANAMAAIWRWKYTAGQIDGRTVRTIKSVRIKFTLHG